MTDPDSTPDSPVLSQDALLISMLAALKSIDKDKRNILTPEIVNEFLIMIYGSHFLDDPGKVETVISEFIVKKIKEAEK